MRFTSAVAFLALASFGAAIPTYSGHPGYPGTVVGPSVYVPINDAYPAFPDSWNNGGNNGGNGNSGNNGGNGNGNGSNNGGNGNGNGNGGNNGGNGNGNGGNNGGNGNGNGGNNGSGNNGNGGGNGSGNGGNNGGNGSGNGSNNGPIGGPVGIAANCGLTGGQVSALTPLVAKLKLTRTVDDLKHLVKQITDLLADTLQKDAIDSVLNIVDSVALGLGLGGLNLQPAVDSVSSILYKQVPCLLDTLLPKF
ncbi:hypothetical protein LPJ66_008202 [Kickxella alabastrina]|uniref:Uncharacterized protein n=1 Tax=Kickxella alabastrina TaxID=61397 RepID=A0ACC1IB27_9FUNG|nr:hypothetical protein LPJ66_008202 [Kickxella alabastrina]